MSKALGQFEDCANCGRPIVRPKPGSYPPAVRWVHIVSPVGEGNRWCDHKGGVATPKMPDWDDPALTTTQDPTP